MRHANIALFVPHAGCPHQCSFCNQRGITGLSNRVSENSVIESIERALLDIENRPDTKFEVAFFGGSFTAIPYDYMVELLGCVQPYIKRGKVSGIRISTRPDAIDENILETLKKYHVTAIELGAQSMDDGVLLANKRGHTANDVVVASKLIRKYGFELGLQMMTGLYKSDYHKDINTAKSLIDINPDTVRIYPTVVMKNTDLESLYISGKYNPMGFEDSVKLCSEILLMFTEKNIKVIRLGLHSSEGIKNNMVAGVWHPSFREICEEYVMTEKAKLCLSKLDKVYDNEEIRINPKDISKFTGRGNAGINRLRNMGYKVCIVQDERVEKGSIYCERVDKK